MVKTEPPLSFLQIWLLSYTNPLQVGEALRDKPAPYWGLAAQVIRAMLDAILLYLPLALMDKQPSSPSWLTFIATEHYYAISVGMAPLFLLGQWLLLGAIMHVTLRLLGRPGGLDQILNITGMAALAVGAVLVVWDWLLILLGWRNVILLGISHLVLDIWAIIIVVAGYKSLLGLPVRLGVILNLVYLALGIALAAIFMRAPL